MERRQHAARGDFEDGAKVGCATTGGGPIEVTIVSLDQRTDGKVAIRALAWEQKAWRVVSPPLGVILKIVPQPVKPLLAQLGSLLFPPPAVVPYKSPLVAWIRFP
jgi:hypothetical protein